MTAPADLPSVLVVSLVDATERRAAFAARAAGASLPWRFFDAKRQLAHGLVYDGAAVERNKGRQLTPGEIGCYSSHFSVWRHMIEHGLRQCIVLEDDTIVDWSFLARLAATDLQAQGIPYLRLYAKTPTFNRIVRRNFIQRSRNLVELVGYAYGTQAYAITLAGAAAFTRVCATIRWPIDDQMDRSWEHGVRNLMLFPAPVLEECVDSEIGTARFAKTQARSAAYTAPRQRLARWIDHQRIRMRKLSLLRAR